MKNEPQGSEESTAPEAISKPIIARFVFAADNTWVADTTADLPTVMVFSKSQQKPLRANISLIRRDPDGAFSALVFYEGGSQGKNTALDKILALNPQLQIEGIKDVGTDAKVEGQKRTLGQKILRLLGW